MIRRYVILSAILIAIGTAWLLWILKPILWQFKGLLWSIYLPMYGRFALLVFVTSVAGFCALDRFIFRRATGLRLDHAEKQLNTGNGFNNDLAEALAEEE